MQKYILIEYVSDDGCITSEMAEISSRELLSIAPVVKAILDTPSVDAHEYSGYEMFGHIDGFETFVQFVPEGENGAHRVKSIKVFMLQDILL